MVMGVCLVVLQGSWRREIYILKASREKELDSPDVYEVNRAMQRMWESKVVRVLPYIGR